MTGGPTHPWPGPVAPLARSAGRFRDGRPLDKERAVPVGSEGGDGAVLGDCRKHEYGAVTIGPPLRSPFAQYLSREPGAAGDPAPQSDSESDPFTKIGSVVFRAGSMDARFGRKVKTIRPRLTRARDAI